LTAVFVIGRRRRQLAAFLGVFFVFLDLPHIPFPPFRRQTTGGQAAVK
jgi:hypothetical protein